MTDLYWAEPQPCGMLGVPGKKSTVFVLGVTQSEGGVGRSRSLGDGREGGTLTGRERQGDMENLNLVHLEIVIQMAESNSPLC